MSLPWMRDVPFSSEALRFAAIARVIALLLVNIAAQSIGSSRTHGRLL